MKDKICCICEAEGTLSRIARCNRIKDTNIIYKTFGIKCTSCGTISAGPVEMRMNKLQKMYADEKSKKEIKA